MMTSTIRKFGVGVASIALVAGMAAPAMAAEIKLPNGLSVDLDAQRLAGDGRVETAMAVAKMAFKNQKPAVAYLVGHDGLIDAATAGMIDNSAAMRGPVLALPSDIKDQKLFALSIKKEFPTVKKLVAIGGTAVVSDASLKAVADSIDIVKTDRIGGADRYETNVAIAKKVFPTTARVYLTRGDNMVDAVTAGTLTQGPILIVPREGEVSKATQDYVKANNPTGSLKVAVIGGENALSDEQASKIFVGEKRDKIDTTPWTAPEIKAALLNSVRTRAALYFGQEAWQKQTKNTLDLTSTEANKDYDKVNVGTGADVNYAGLGGSTNVTTKSEDPADINITAEITTTGKGFEGYQPIYVKADNAKKELEKAGATSILARKQAVETARQELIDAAADDKKASAVLAKASSSKAENLYKALVDLYGKAAVDANWVKLDTASPKKNIVETGFLKFDGTDEDALFTGLDTEAIAGQVTADKKSKDKVASANGQAVGTDMDIAELAKRDASDFTALLGALTLDGAANTKINLVALQELVNERFDKYQNTVKQAKIDLINAVRKYYSADDPNGSKQDGSGKKGMIRISGANRYETSAYLSIFQSKSQSATGPITGEDRSADMVEQYFASGNDGNLIDAVFAGQLTKGTILLLPAEGSVDPLVITELKRKGAPKFRNGEGIFPALAYAVGGKKAISDDVFTEALNAMGSI